jgi:hypothetical protein
MIVVPSYEAVSHVTYSQSDTSDVRSRSSIIILLT